MILSDTAKTEMFRVLMATVCVVGLFVMPPQAYGAAEQPKTALSKASTQVVNSDTRSFEPGATNPRFREPAKKQAPPNTAPEKDKTQVERISEQVAAIRSLITNGAFSVLLIAVPLFLYWEWRRQIFIIDQIEIPKSLTEKGYTASVVAQRIADHIFDIQRIARVQKRENSIEIGGSQIDFQVPVANLSTRAFVRYVKQVLGKVETRIRGEIIEETPGSFSIQLRTGDGRATPCIPAGASTDLTSILRLAAEQILMHCDPYMMTQFWFFVEETSGNFSRTYEAIKYCLSRTDSKQHKRAYSAWGNVLGRQRKFDEAVAKYTIAVELDSKFPSAYNNWGNTLRLRRCFGEAIEKYQMALRYDPNYAFPIHNLGLVYGDIRQFDKAIECFERAIKLNAKYASAYGNLGNAQRLIGNFELAEAAQRRAIDLDPQLIWPYIQLANTLSRTGRRSESIEMLEIAKLTDPRLPNTYATWGDVLTASRQYRAAIEKYQEALQCDANFYWAFNGWAHTLRRMQQPREAIEKIREALAIQPRFGIAIVSWGDALADLRKYEEAISKYEAALSLEDAITPSCIGWGRALNATNQSDRALEKLKDAVKLEPFNASAHVVLGRVLLKQNQVDKALSCFEHGFERDQSNLWALCASGDALRRKFSAEEARSRYAQASAIDSDFPDAWCGLGYLEFDVGNYDDAIALFEKAIQLDPFAIGGYVGFARTLLTRGGNEEVERGSEICRAQLARTPWVSDFSRILGDSSLARGNREEAVQFFSDALRCDTHDNWARLGLGRALSRDGQKQRALDAIDDCIRRDRYFTAAYRERAKIFAESGEFAAALTELEAAARSDTYDPWIYIQMGDLLRSLKRPDDAYGSYAHAGRLAPADIRVRRVLERKEGARATAAERMPTNA
jgi:superkiller protein 3